MHVLISGAVASLLQSWFSPSFPTVIIIANETCLYLFALESWGQFRLSHEAVSSVPHYCALKSFHGKGMYSCGLLHAKDQKKYCLYNTAIQVQKLHKIHNEEGALEVRTLEETNKISWSIKSSRERRYLFSQHLWKQEFCVCVRECVCVRMYDSLHLQNTTEKV